MSDTLLGHPKGLFICFMTELWERFAYYGMLSLLILYLVKTYLISDAEGNKIVAAYGALVWMLPVIGGIIADKWLGSRKSVTLGALLMCLGFVSISFPGALSWLFGGIDSSDGTPPLNTLFFSMAVIITGVGFLKTNISTVVGALYAQDDPRRDSGFTTFYMGINIGGMLGPIVCGGIGATFGLRYGFVAAGLGMLVALATFIWGQKFLGGRAEPPNPQALKKSIFAGLNTEWLIYLGALLLIVVLWQSLTYYNQVSDVLIWFAGLLGLVICYFSLFRCEPQERDRMLVVAVLIAFSIAFWSLYQQMFGSLTLFADRLVDREVFGTEIGTSQLLGFPSIFVVALAPVFSLIWFKLAQRKVNPSIPAKFSVALVLVGLAFLMPTLGQLTSERSDQIGLFWFLMIFFLMVCGELCKAPIAMSMITKLCPKRVVGMMMGAYFVSLSVGSIVAGKLAAKYTSVDLTPAGELANPSAALETYSSAFASFGYAAIAIGILLYLIAPLLYRRMHDHDESTGVSLLVRICRVVINR